jgi:ribulose kinase
MRGSIVGLTLVCLIYLTYSHSFHGSYLTNCTQDSTLSDLARKFHLTLEAIALQTRHIVDEMNAHGHRIRAIYMSGSQAKNAALMSLLANCCGMPVILPASASAAVVLGAAMLGRFAAEAAARSTPLSPREQGEALWKTMVRIFTLLAWSESA